jgi:hypothetical protein
MRRSRRAWLVAVAGLACLAAGAAFATIPDSNGVIHACYKSGGQLRVIDPDTGSCGSNETALSWSVQGPPGLTGLEVIEAESATSSETLQTATAICPAGKTVIGGGGVASPQSVSTPFALIGSRPDPTQPEAWTAVGKEIGQTDDTHRMVAWAYCALVS